MTGRPERMEQTVLTDLMVHQARRAFRESKDHEEPKAQEGRVGQKGLPGRKGNKGRLEQVEVCLVWWSPIQRLVTQEPSAERRFRTAC